MCWIPLCHIPKKRLLGPHLKLFSIANGTQCSGIRHRAPLRREVSPVGEALFMFMVAPTVAQARLLTTRESGVDYFRLYGHNKTPIEDRCPMEDRQSALG